MRKRLVFPSVLLLALSLAPAHAVTRAGARKKPVKRSAAAVAQPQAAAVPRAQQARRPASQAADFLVFFPDSNVEVARLAGFPLNVDTYAVRLGSSANWSQLAKGFRVFHLGAKYTQVSLAHIDSYSGWAIFKASPTDFKQEWKSSPLTPPAQLASKLTPVSQIELQKEFAAFRRRFTFVEAPGASAAPAYLVARDLSRIESAVLSEVSFADGHLALDGMKVAPRLKGADCVTSATKLEDQQLRAVISAASTIRCRAGSIRADLDSFGLAVTSGVIRLKLGTKLSDDLKMLLLDEVSKPEIEAHRAVSLEIENSSPSECSQARILLNFLDGRFCTRTLLPLKDFQDTVTALGRFSGDRFVYTIIRAKTFSPKGTIQLVDAVMNLLGQPHDK